VHVDLTSLDFRSKMIFMPLRFLILPHTEIPRKNSKIDFLPLAHFKSI